MKKSTYQNYMSFPCVKCKQPCYHKSGVCVGCREKERAAKIKKKEVDSVSVKDFIGDL